MHLHGTTAKVKTKIPAMYGPEDGEAYTTGYMTQKLLILHHGKCWDYILNPAGGINAMDCRHIHQVMLCYGKIYVMVNCTAML